MPKPAKSQWNFGELFPAESLRRVFTVSELTLSVKRLIEGQIGRVWVTGEITNFRLQSSGHAYFSVKDAGAALNCVLFRDEARGVQRDVLCDGQKVTLQGEMTVYEARGQYQLRVTTVELQGVGALQAAFERLKQKLQAAGWFDTARKRPLPRFSQRVGIVTSPTGAALQDVLHAVERRQPALELVLAPCRVQGQGAAGEIAAAIRLLNEWSERGGSGKRLDLVLVTRGGGSLEDLWAFNEEEVARAIYESKLPVISAVGHEIDFTISDFVADLRAATPTAAAELITEGAFASRQFVAEARELLRISMARRFADERGRLSQLQQRLARLHPRRRLQERAQRLDDLQSSLPRCLRYGCRTRRTELAGLQQRFLRLRLAQRLVELREILIRNQNVLLERAGLELTARQTRLAQAAGRLRLLSPENVLARGYSITLDVATGQVLRDPGKLKVGQRLRTRLHQGEVESQVCPPTSPPSP